jgi:hypothetical protein
MALYLKLDQKTWVQEDYTDSTTYDISGTVYRNNILTTAETSLNTFTGTFRLIDQEGKSLFSTQSGLTLNSDGTFQMTFAQGKTPTLSGNTKVRILLEKSGSRLTAIGVSGSDELFIEWD